MGSVRRNLAWFGSLWLAGCTVAGPIVDPSLDGAPVSACTRFDAADAGPQCLTVFRRGPNREALLLTAGELRAGETIYATQSGAEGCEGRFTHFVATGDTMGPGALSLKIGDAVGRGDVGRQFRWDESRTGRRWSVGRIDRPLHIPGTIRIEMEEGELRLTSLCLRSYHDG